MISTEEDNTAWTQVSHNSRTRQQNLNTSNTTTFQPERRQCQECRKMCLVNLNGRLRSHQCNNNSFNALRETEEENLELENEVIIVQPTEAISTQKPAQNLEIFKHGLILVNSNLWI